MSREDLRRWIANRRIGAEREREESRKDGPRNVVSAALDLISLAGTMLGWPAPVDPLDERDDERARDTWVRLRQRLARKT